MKTWYALTLLCALLLGLSLPAQADTCTASASSLAFGNISPIANTATTASGTLIVTCTWSLLSLTPNVLVCANLGTGDGSTSSVPRSLANGSDRMSFNIYSDASYSTVWGSVSTTAAATPMSATLSLPLSILTGSQSTSLNFYGQVPAGQTTVPTVSNGNTIYSASFAAYTRLDYKFYALVVPTCASMTAGTGTFPLTVTATAVNNCNISTTPLSFGSSPLINTSLASTASISVQCTNGDAYKVALDGGTTSGAVASRKMTGANSQGTVNYQLYADATHATVWGDGTNSTATVTGTGTGLAQTLTVYGQVPSQTAPIPDSYTDTVKATIYF